MGEGWESAFVTSPEDDVCAEGQLTTQGGRWQASSKTIDKSRSVSTDCRLQGTLKVQVGVPRATHLPPLASRFAKYYKLENGSEYRTLLKAFGIRFDVLVYGNVSPRAGVTAGHRGGNPDRSWAPKSLLCWGRGGEGKVLPLTSSESLS